jgi:peptide chain release factor 1
MFEKLLALEEKFNQIEARLSDPNVISDQNTFKALMKERKMLEPIVEAFGVYKAKKTAVDEAAEILETETDKELRELAEEEYYSGKDELVKMEEELKILLLPKDPNDDRSVIVEIRGGAGGEEAALFAHSLFRMYSMYAEQKRYKLEVIDINETELGGIKEISFSIDGEGAYSRLKYESGVHRVQRVPETESSGRIHTSTVTVAVLPEADDVEVTINPADLQIETHRSGGAGGQHVNKTESAIRIIHIPTGIVVDCQDERSQHKNKEKALKVLRSKIYEKMQSEQDAKIAGERRSQVGTGDRSERIRTYNFPQGRVTDHRIGLTLYKIDAVMNGGLDELIDPLRAHDRAEKLRGEEN